MTLAVGAANTRKKTIQSHSEYTMVLWHGYMHELRADNYTKYVYI